MNDRNPRRATCLSGVRRYIALGACLLVVACGEEPKPAPPTPGDGASEAPVPKSAHDKMLALLQDVLRRVPEEHYYQGDRVARRLREERRRVGAAASWQLYRDSGIAELQLGNERAGIDLLAFAHRRLTAGTMRGDATALAEVAFNLGIGYLRLAETENCCEQATPESCLIPLRGGGLHDKKEGATNAVRYFSEVIEATPSGSHWNLAAKWLITIAYMALGQHPHAVPKEHLIPLEAFDPEPELGFPRFVNIAAEVGLDRFNLSGGVIIDDFDNDDYLDVVTSTWDKKGQLRLYRNNRDGTFIDRTEEAGLTGLFGGLCMNQADFDNDGDVDILVLRGAWLFENGCHPNSLIRNNGDGTFTDITMDTGLGDVHYPTQTAAWADFDHDGDLDLAIGNESSETVRYPCQLFRNEGDGTFAEISEAAGITNYGYCKSICWGDFDNDRFPDLYMSNNGRPNRLYHNRGDGTFVDVAPKLGITEPVTSFPAWFWDYDNDGSLDLYVSCFGTDISHIAMHYLGMPLDCDRARLYRGDGGNSFTNVAKDMGLTYPSMPMGHNFGDLNGDGFLDFYLGTGNVFYHSVMPNLMFLNRRGQKFTDVTVAGGFGHVQKGHGISFADLDNDGDQDVFAQMGGAFAGDGFRDALYENPGFENHWITIHLIGTDSNRSAIGSRIRVDVVEADAKRSIYRHVCSGATFGSSPLRQNIGLGKATELLSIEVFWPKTGKTQMVEGASFDQMIRVVEGQPGFTEIQVDTLKLGGR